MCESLLDFYKERLDTSRKEKETDVFIAVYKGIDIHEYDILHGDLVLVLDYLLNPEKGCIAVKFIKFDEPYEAMHVYGLDESDFSIVH